MYPFAWDRGKSGKDNLGDFRGSVNPQESFVFVAHVRNASVDYSVPIIFDLDFARADIEEDIGNPP